jgi:uncharacterized protein YukE
MAQYTIVDPEKLFAQGERFAAAGATSKQIVLRLNNLVQSLNECWGNDETGKAFFKTYGEQRDLLLEGMYGVEGLLEQIADGLRTMAKHYKDANDANQNTVS